MFKGQGYPESMIGVEIKDAGIKQGGKPYSYLIKPFYCMLFWFCFACLFVFALRNFANHQHHITVFNFCFHVKNYHQFCGFNKLSCSSVTQKAREGCQNQSTGQLKHLSGNHKQGLSMISLLLSQNPVPCTYSNRCLQGLTQSQLKAAFSNQRFVTVVHFTLKK